MRAILLLIIAIFSISLYAQKSDTLTVTTFNLRYGELASMKQFAEYINSQHSDLVALQECDWKTFRNEIPQQNGVPFLNELAFYTNMFGLYGKAIDFCGGYYGIALLSKYPIVRSERFLLPNPIPNTEQRVLLIADIEMPNGSIISFFCTHLEYSSPEARKSQIKFINKKVKENKYPVVLAGDLNAKPDDAEIANGFSNWYQATDSTSSFPGTKQGIKIDYIMGYPRSKTHLIFTKTDTSCHLSDHFPVSSKIIINP